MTEEQKIIADKVVSFFKGIAGESRIYTSISNEIGENKQKTRFIIATLAHKGILVQDFEHPNYYHLSDNGFSYENYDKLLDEEKRVRDLEEALLTSSISANKSTKFVNSLFWITAIFAFLSAIASVGIFILELRKE